MNDEIKEILDKLKDNDWYDELDLTGDKWIELKQTEINKLLDYITNLQQSGTDKQLEIMKLKDRLEKQRKEYQDTYKDVRIEIKEKNDTITNLQQENERLKERVNQYENPDDMTLFYMWLDEKAKDKMKELKQANKTLHENNQNMQEEMARVWKENERLKEENKHIFANVNDDELLISNAMNYAEAQDYKSRCEKAIEYNNQLIKDTKDFYRPTADIIYSGDSLIEIATNNINILQNGSDSQ